MQYEADKRPKRAGHVQGKVGQAKAFGVGGRHMQARWLIQSKAGCAKAGQAHAGKLAHAEYSRPCRK